MKENSQESRDKMKEQFLELLKQVKREGIN